MSKIIDKIRQCVSNGQFFFSFEFFPPKTENGVNQLLARMDHMATLEPMFVSVTCGLNGYLIDTTLYIAETAQKFLAIDVLMHITCYGQKIEKMRQILQKCREIGVRNILVSRGYTGNRKDATVDRMGDFGSPVDFIRFVREEFGNFFCIGVVFTIETNQEALDQDSSVGLSFNGDSNANYSHLSLNSSLSHLKSKIDAGAEFIVTDIIFDASQVSHFIAQCRNHDIHCPIIPSVIVVSSPQVESIVDQFVGPTHLSNSIKLNLSASTSYSDAGVSLAVQICRDLMVGTSSSSNDRVSGIHFSTLNLERFVDRVLDDIGLSHVGPRRSLPYRRRCPSANNLLSSVSSSDNDINNGGQLSVQLNIRQTQPRPTNWTYCPKSYIQITEASQESVKRSLSNDGTTNNSFNIISPTGDAGNPFFRRLEVGTVKDRRVMWGESLLKESDICRVFCDFIEGRIPCLPWCECRPLPETQVILSKLLCLNQAGLLTINSQPAVNGIASDHRVYGWGGPGGWIYQKSYVDLFCSPAKLSILLDSYKLSKMTSIEIHAIDVSGHTYSAGPKTSNATAVSWGVFPNKEILQPTVFDMQIFNEVWAKVAFGLWQSLWASIYDEDSQSSELLHRVHDNYFLVAICDHDFTNGSVTSTSTGSDSGSGGVLFNWLEEVARRCSQEADV